MCSIIFLFLLKMFHKSIRIKTNNQIKSSEKKCLIKDILAQYSTLNEETLKAVINIKDCEINLTKLYTHSGNDVQVYMVDKIPYIFKHDKNEQLIPTVYFLWKFPDILPKFFTHPNVFDKLVNGADLMLPGVIVKEELNLNTFKHIKKDQLCVVCLQGNSVPIAIGRAAMSGEDMYMSSMRGKCINILHIYHDQLWALGDQSLTMPIIANTDVEVKEVDVMKSTIESEINTEAINIQDLKISNKSQIDDEHPEEPKELTDDLLKTIFVAALKFKSKEFTLPVILSALMKTLQFCCPQSCNFDIKQTSYKKMGNFIKEMEHIGLIKTKEAQKGVLSITDINKEHDLFKFVRKPTWLTSNTNAERDAKLSMIDIIEMYKVDGNSDILFKGKYKKGTILNAAEIRQHVTNYIKEAELQSHENKRMVKIDFILADFLKETRQEISFEDLFVRIFNKMTPMHSINFKYDDFKEREEPVIRKGKFKPIEFKIVSRGGNKKVTIVENLDELLVDSKELQQRVKTLGGCSVSVEEAASGSGGFTLSIQGNQINQVSSLLKVEYGIQLKYMKGLEFGTKD